MREIVFVGLGLHDELGVSLRGLEEARTAKHVFMELYTSLMPSLSIEHLEELSGRKIAIVTRNDLEEKNGEKLLKATETGKSVLLVPGDPLVATTHVALRVQAERMGIKTRIVHGASIVSAVMGLSGLHNYKFGKTVTIPFPEENPSETPYETITQNKTSGLHTLCLLDMKAEEKRYMTIHEGLTSLLEMENRKHTGTVEGGTIAIGIARAGSPSPIVKAAYIRDLLDHDFGGCPHSLIFPGELHFMEAEALIAFAGGPERLRGVAR